MRIGSMICGAEIYEGCDEEKRRAKWAIVGFNGEILHWVRWLHWGGLRIH